MKNKEPVHLHTLWQQGAVARRGVTIGYALCGKRVGTEDQPAGSQLTSHADDATCKECLKRAEKKI